MSHSTKTIMWLLCALIMVACSIVSVIEQNWLLLILDVIVFILDIANAWLEFAAWSRELEQKYARKEDENDT